jgi:hypothetical protein
MYKKMSLTETIQSLDILRRVNMDPQQEPSTQMVEQEESLSPVQATEGFAEREEEKDPVFFFKLGNGYVEPGELSPPASADPSKEAQPFAGRRRRGFFFHNRNLTDDIWMFGNQVARLVDELPTAFVAYSNRDYSYRFEVVKNKGQLVTLEVTLYQDRTFLFLKKYFKPRLPLSDEIDEASDWLPTPAVISLDPTKDKPLALLKFAMGAHRPKGRPAASDATAATA